MGREAGREVGTAAGQQPWTKHQHLPAWWRAARLERGRESNTFVPNSGSWRVGEGDVLDLRAPARTGYLDVDVHLQYGSSVTTGDWLRNGSREWTHIPVCPGQLCGHGKCQNWMDAADPLQAQQPECWVGLWKARLD